MCVDIPTDKKVEFAKTALHAFTGIVTFITIMVALWTQTHSINSTAVQYAASTVTGSTAGYGSIIKSSQALIGQSNYVQQTQQQEDSLLNGDTSFILDLINNRSPMNNTRYILYATAMLSRIVNLSAISNDWDASCRILSILKLQPKSQSSDFLHSIINCIHAVQCNSFTATSKILPPPLTMVVLSEQIVDHLKSRYNQFQWITFDHSEQNSESTTTYIIALRIGATEEEIEEYKNPPFTQGIYVGITEHWYWVTSHPQLKVTIGRTKTYDGPRKSITSRMLRHIERGVDQLSSKQRPKN